MREGGQQDHDAAARTTADADCLGCRLTGSATLLGLSAYFFYERNKVARSKVAERRWLLACTGAFAAAGLWRATTGLFDSAPPPSAQSQQER
ncbi:hypothetical protein Gpo141_00008321 [Globisporangium polare]